MPGLRFPAYEIRRSAPHQGADEKAMRLSLQYTSLNADAQVGLSVKNTSRVITPHPCMQ